MGGETMSLCPPTFCSPASALMEPRVLPQLSSGDRQPRNPRWDLRGRPRLSAHLSEKLLEGGRKEREEERARSETSEEQSGGRAGYPAAPPSPGTVATAPTEPALTGRPALSQRLSGKGLPARTTQGKDTGCLSSTRTVEALLAICGGAVGTGDGSGHPDARGRSPGAQRRHGPPLLPREPVGAAG